MKFLFWLGVAVVTLIFGCMYAGCMLQMFETTQDLSGRLIYGSIISAFALGLFAIIVGALVNIYHDYVRK